ncbi:MAG TPA: MFS transporter, partial [Rhizobiales bacterium]|nr:MFS transporter [Hyphomicrobiales bacterium]
MKHSPANLLKTRRFAPLFITQALGAFNDNAFKSALAIVLTYDLAGKTDYNPAVLITIATGVFIAPFFLFSGV